MGGSEGEKTARKMGEKVSAEREEEERKGGEGEMAGKDKKRSWW